MQDSYYPPTTSPESYSGTDLLGAVGALGVLLVGLFLVSSPVLATGFATLLFGGYLLGRAFRASSHEIPMPGTGRSILITTGSDCVDANANASWAYTIAVIDDSKAQTTR
jgi:hypothetical protein